MEPANNPNRVVEKDLVVWTASARPFKRQDRQFYVTTFSIAGIIALVLFLAEGIMPVLLIVSLMFLYYILSTVEPGQIEYKVTNIGIKIAGNLTPWGNINRCWFSKKLGSEVLVLETNNLSGRLELVTIPEIKDQLNEAVSEYIQIEEVKVSGVEKLTDWLVTRLSGNS